jgi:hypothetical protein
MSRKYNFILFLIAVAMVLFCNCGGSGVGSPSGVNLLSAKTKITAKPIAGSNRDSLVFTDQSGLVFKVASVKFMGFGIEITLPENITDLEAAKLEIDNEAKLKTHIVTVPEGLNPEFYNLYIESMIDIIRNRLIISIPWEFFYSKDSIGLDSMSGNILDSLILPDGTYSRLLLGFSKETKTDFRIENLYQVKYEIDGTVYYALKNNPFFIDGFLIDHILCTGTPTLITRTIDNEFSCNVDISGIVADINISSLISDSTLIFDSFLGNSLIIHSYEYSGQNSLRYAEFITSLGSNIKNSGKLRIR